MTNERGGAPQGGAERDSLRRFCRATALALSAAACGAPAAREAPPAPTATAAVAAPNTPVVLFLGTSLTAGFGLDPEQAFPALLQRRIEQAALPHRVVNAGVSGETSAGARRRVDWLLQQRVDVLVVETGANDALRGQDPGAIRDNIQAIVDRARSRPSPPRIVLLGMEAPPNNGADYAGRFRRMFADLARSNRVALVPFLLEGVAGIPDLNQPDGIHPTAEGHRRMADTVWSVLEPVLRHASADIPSPQRTQRPQSDGGSAP